MRGVAHALHLEQVAHHALEEALPVRRDALRARRAGKRRPSQLPHEDAVPVVKERVPVGAVRKDAQRAHGGSCAARTPGASGTYCRSLLPPCTSPPPQETAPTWCFRLPHPRLRWSAGGLPSRHTPEDSVSGSTVMGIWWCIKSLVLPACADVLLNRASSLGSAVFGLCLVSGEPAGDAGAGCSCVPVTTPLLLSSTDGSLCWASSIAPICCVLPAPS